MPLGIDELSGMVIVLIAFIPMSSRRDLYSMSELDDKVRSKNPFDAFQNLSRSLRPSDTSSLLLRSFTVTSFDLKKPG